MPRAARVKRCDYIYHIMCRSISDVNLFRDNRDKESYLRYVKKYQEKFHFKVYAYCLMTTHVHLIIDSNGADISKIMHGINQCYAQCFNLRHDRHGHLFQDRFKSKVVTSNRYLLTLSLYIHNNPANMKKYKKYPEKFKYSSLSAFLGLKKDAFRILDESFIMTLLGSNVINAHKNYYNLLHASIDYKAELDTEFANEKSEYRSGRKVMMRDFNPKDIMKFTAKCTGIDESMLKMKHRRFATEGRALCAMLMRCLCDFSYKDICGVLGNLTQSRVSELCNIGIELTHSRKEYQNVIESFFKNRAS